MPRSLRARAVVLAFGVLAGAVCPPAAGDDLHAEAGRVNRLNAADTGRETTARAAAPEVRELRLEEIARTLGPHRMALPGEVEEVAERYRALNSTLERLEVGARELPAAISDAPDLAFPQDAPSAGQAAPGGAVDGGELSAEEAARQLTNPNTPLASLTLKSQWRRWDGDLPGADGRESGTFLFQPSFPFPVSKTDAIFFRPAVSYLVNQPLPDSGGGVRSRSGFGDMGFDLAYGRTAESGVLTAVGMVGGVPIGAGPLSSETWSLGPELFVGYFQPWGLVGIFPNHQFDVSGDAEISLTTIQPMASFLLGEGWSVASAGLITFDWHADQWTVPLQVQVSKTIKVGQLPIKLALEVNYYVEQSDALGPEWMIGFNLTPVVPNLLAQLLGAK